MLDLKFIKDNQELVQAAIESKNVSLSLRELLLCEQRVADCKKQMEAIQTERNANAKKVSQVPSQEREGLIARGKEIARELEHLKPKLHDLERRLREYLLLVPNIPAKEAPVGKDESFNVEVKKWGEKPVFDFLLSNHAEILRKNNWADLERISHVCGSRTYALKNEMVLLEIALWQFALHQARSKGFELISLPSLVRDFALYGTGHFPGGRDQVYFLPKDNLYLSGTAEVPINSLHSKEILQEEQLPLLYAGFSSCFRRESGSAGRDVKGVIRVHQFYKVELFVICKNDPEESLFWLHELLQISEEIMQALELPYRVIECCTGDMGLGKVRMFDIEAWVPSEGKYRETHSCSSLYDWQARRSNVRYRSVEGGVRFCHTLNNTAIATPRILAPFLENHQKKDFSIYIPLALRPYVAGQKYLAPAQN